MKDLKEGLKEELKNDEIQLLRTGMSDNANLLNEDELGEIFGGYISCPKKFKLECSGGFTI